MSELWVTDAGFVDLRRVLESLIAAKSFPGLHSVGFTGETVLRAIDDRPGAYRETVFYLVPQRDGSTRIEIVNDPETTAEPLAWGIVWHELRKLGYRVLPRDSEEDVTTLAGDPWVDLEEITPLSHRKIIRALKEDYYSNQVRKQKLLAAELRVSPGTLSTVKKKWLRETQTKRKEMNESNETEEIERKSEPKGDPL